MKNDLIERLRAAAGVSSEALRAELVNLCDLAADALEKAKADADLIAESWVKEIECSNRRRDQLAKVHELAVAGSGMNVAIYSSDLLDILRK